MCLCAFCVLFWGFFGFFLDPSWSWLPQTPGAGNKLKAEDPGGGVVVHIYKLKPSCHIFTVIPPDSVTSFTSRLLLAAARIQREASGEGCRR